MKILGSTILAYETSGYIVEMSAKEMSQIRGNQWGSGSTKLAAGAEVEVHKTWNLLMDLRTKFREFNDAKRKLEAVISILELPKSFIEIAEQVETTS